jgi:hypothetical protein
VCFGVQIWLWRRFGAIHSCCANQAGLKEIELSASVHLAFYQLELGNLPFGLSKGL